MSGGVGDAIGLAVASAVALAVCVALLVGAGVVVNGTVGVPVALSVGLGVAVGLGMAVSVTDGAPTVLVPDASGAAVAVTVALGGVFVTRALAISVGLFEGLGVSGAGATNTRPLMPGKPTSVQVYNPVCVKVRVADAPVPMGPTRIAP